MAELYASITGLSGITDVSVSTSHASAVAVAVISCITCTANIGDEITVDLGYTTDHGVIFKGYIKQIDRKYPDNSYIITAHDFMTRAVDFFIVSTNPETPFTRTNISAEDLVQDVLELAGLTSFDLDPTGFVFATNSEAEVDLTSAYDYCNYIADTLTWHLYADETGTIHFVNRKPYVMKAGSPESAQPGFHADVSQGTINDALILDFVFKKSEVDLRNKVVVQGSAGVYAEASAASPYLPAGYYKTVAFGTPLINDTSYAQQAADYNLIILNRLTQQISMSVVGSHEYMARKTFTVTENISGINEDYYTLMCEHSWSKSGYVCSMELRK